MIHHLIAKCAHAWGKVVLPRAGDERAKLGEIACNAADSMRILRNRAARASGHKEKARAQCAKSKAKARGARVCNHKINLIIKIAAHACVENHARILRELELQKRKGAVLGGKNERMCAHEDCVARVCEQPFDTIRIKANDSIEVAKILFV